MKRSQALFWKPEAWGHGQKGGETPKGCRVLEAAPGPAQHSMGMPRLAL